MVADKTPQVYRTDDQSKLANRWKVPSFRTISPN